MNDDKMGSEQYDKSPYGRTDRIVGECSEIVHDILGIALQLTNQGRIDILQAPS